MGCSIRNLASKIAKYIIFGISCICNGKNRGDAKMSKYEWSGGINDTILGMEVIACRDGMSEPPIGLKIIRQSGNDVDEVRADERFMIVLKLEGVWAASIHPSLVK